ncbi:MAG: protein translocase subunit SecF [Proteobacteria bacterium]|nr:protein translocase subunit SecF [Pseudomonadota bacterium]
MQFIKSDINIDFIGKRKIAFTASLVLIIASIISLIIHQGPRLGVDFEGGSSLQIKFQNHVELNDIKKGLEPLGLEKSSTQRFGAKQENEFQIRTSASFMNDEDFQNKFKESMKNTTGQEPEIMSTDMVGPQVSKDLRGKALFAIFYSLLFITIYISGRFEMKWMISAVMTGVLMTVVYLLSMFNVSIPILIIVALMIALILCWYLELKYAMGAIVALIHDVTITVGLFSIFDLEFNLPIIAAILTIIGYSLNDTIIVFDRIRENLKKNSRKPLQDNINRSINETLSRTILTSLTTLFVVVALFLLGGATIHDFSFALLVGIAVGTYSSIYVASPILIAWQEFGRS